MGLLVISTVVVGFAATLAGVGLLGGALRRADFWDTGVILLLAAPAVPAVLVTLRLAALLPTQVGWLVVSTNAALVPLRVAWLTLGRLLWRRPLREGGG